MNEVTADTFFAEIEEHFRNAAYQQALDCATLGAQRFPAVADGFTYFRMCAAARLNEHALLKQMVADSLEQGVWYSEFLWRESPSFIPLQGMSEFELLVQANLKLRAEQAAAGKAPAALTLAPEQAAPPYPALIVLHGNASTAQAEVDAWRPAAAQGWLLAMPESSQMHWPGHCIWNDYETAKRDVLDYYEALCANYPLDRERLVLAGFSLGGQVALRLALEGAIPARGFILHEPYTPAQDPWVERIVSAPARGMRGYFVASENDQGCTLESIQAVANSCTNHGIPCHLKTITDQGHAYPPDFELHLAEGLDFVMGNK